MGSNHRGDPYIAHFSHTPPDLGGKRYETVWGGYVPPHTPPCPPLADGVGMVILGVVTVAVVDDGNDGGCVGGSGSCVDIVNAKFFPDVMKR